jgi:hypothetical protein
LFLVFDEERRRVKAWYAVYVSSGGDLEKAQEAEREELNAIRREKEELDERNHRAFAEMVRAGERVKRERELEEARTGVKSILGATGSNGEFNPYSGESIIPVPENPELTKIREQRLQEILQKGNNQVETLPTTPDSSLTIAPPLPPPASINIEVESEKGKENEDQPRREESDIKWTKFRITEDEEVSESCQVQDSSAVEGEGEKGGVTEEILEEGINPEDISFSLSDENVEGGEGTTEEGPSTDLLELD